MLKLLRSNWLPFILGVSIIAVIFNTLLSGGCKEINLLNDPAYSGVVPSMDNLPKTAEADQLRYGRDLVSNTSAYFGPKGRIAHSTNGMNCQNCHLDGGTLLYSNNFLSVAHGYPKYRDRSGKLESVEERINDCFERSLDGKSIDSSSKEMRALVAYINWVGKNIKDLKMPGLDYPALTYLDRAADSGKGRIIYESKCVSCHQRDGVGVIRKDGLAYLYPPLWGANSYTSSAGMYRLSRLANFIKVNMPLGATYQNPGLNDSEAWDVAAYICSRDHPVKLFPSDWPNINTKPLDYPFGPYADNFSEQQHKYGPYLAMRNKK